MRTAARFFLVFMISASLSSVFARYEDRFTGQWNMISITSGTQTRKIPEGAVANWEFFANGTGIIKMQKQGRMESKEFTWMLRGKTLLLGEKNGTAKPDELQFGFYDDYLFLMKAPDDNILLKKAAAGSSEEEPPAPPN